MEEKTYYIVNLNTNQFYTGIEDKAAKYSENKEDAKILNTKELGSELMKIRLLGELVDHKEV